MNEHKVVTPAERPRVGAGGASSVSCRPSVSSLSSLGTAVWILFLPKCPLCLVALLGVVGLGSGTAAGVAAIVAPLLRPVAVVLLAVAGVPLLRSGRRATKRWTEHARRSKKEACRSCV
jgi:hypothetical protein